MALQSLGTTVYIEREQSLQYFLLKSTNEYIIQFCIAVCLKTHTEIKGYR